ncbi:hypothetical protein SERLA73DRAFT_148895 [Serpula lacrymans var. lacrymans S7.3]|uniref:Uncharacterized protein n=1 Tax=Serpula lacrymans var. lacrymans (strain S7.3) TaxID=936435 RepID=F8PGK0_SERL3|nr:hypothetical protein SERLA73DRAFT_148895 [Serpula lacrymans var. lacrymans S7.3]
MTGHVTWKNKSKSMKKVKYIFHRLLNKNVVNIVIEIVYNIINRRHHQDNHMPQPLAGPAYPQLQPSFQMQQGNQLLATHGVDYNKRLLDWFQNGHAERVNQRRNRLQRQEQAEDQMIQHQEAIQLQKQEQQLAENHMHQEREIERQETIRLWVQQHSQHADLRYEGL